VSSFFLSFSKEQKRKEKKIKKRDGDKEIKGVLRSLWEDLGAHLPTVVCNVATHIIKNLIYILTDINFFLMTAMIILN
jgi:hypothetical protein